MTSRAIILIIATGNLQSRTMKRKPPNQRTELEAEKKAIEDALCSGTLSVDELTEKSKRLPVLSDEIDEKTMRWMELSEIEG